MRSPEGVPRAPSGPVKRVRLCRLVLPPVEPTFGYRSPVQFSLSEGKHLWLVSKESGSSLDLVPPAIGRQTTSRGHMVHRLVAERLPRLLWELSPVPKRQSACLVSATQPGCNRGGISNVRNTAWP